MPQRPIPTLHMRSGSTRSVGVDFGPADTGENGLLDSGESLTGNVTITSSSADLTTSNATVNTGNLAINGRTVPAGQGVQWSMTSSVAGSYTLTVNVSTDATPVQVFNEPVTVVVE